MINSKSPQILMVYSRLGNMLADYELDHFICIVNEECIDLSRHLKRRKSTKLDSCSSPVAILAPLLDM